MSAGHGAIRLVGAVCVCGCGRPARELGGHCTPCWMGLTAAERAHEVWLRDVARRAAEAAAIDELCALYELDAVDPPGRAA